MSEYWYILVTVKDTTTQRGNEMTTNQTLNQLKDATEDMATVVQLHRKGRLTEARTLLLECHSIRASVMGGVQELLVVMDRFDAAFFELYTQLYEG